jgi:hypothetical protein
MSNNAAERELRAIALGRRNWTSPARTKVAVGRLLSSRP